MIARHLVAKAKAGILSSRGGNSFIKSLTLIRPPISSKIGKLCHHVHLVQYENFVNYMLHIMRLKSFHLVHLDLFKVCSRCKWFLYNYHLHPHNYYQGDSLSPSAVKMLVLKVGTISKEPRRGIVFFRCKLLISTNPASNRSLLLWNAKLQVR